jgi:hypothetical protein
LRPRARYRALIGLWARRKRRDGGVDRECWKEGEKEREFFFLSLLKQRGAAQRREDEARFQDADSSLRCSPSLPLLSLPFSPAPPSLLSLSLSLSLFRRAASRAFRGALENSRRGLTKERTKLTFSPPPSLSRNFKQKQQKQNSSPFLQVPPQAASPTRPPRSSRSTASEATRSGPTAGPRSPRSPTSSRRSPGTMPSRCGAAPTPGTRPTLSWSRAT